MSILDSLEYGMPSFFQYLSDKKLITSDLVLFTRDGFCMINKSISSMLISHGPKQQTGTNRQRNFCIPEFDLHGQEMFRFLGK